jgi:hypothetical protein
MNLIGVFMSYDPQASKLGHLFQLKPLLMQRGHDLASLGSLNQTIFEKLNTIKSLTEDEFFGILHINENRKKIRVGMLNDSEIELDKYRFKLVKAEVVKFTSAFEWYVSQILLREFNFFCSGFNNKINGAAKGADFDVLGLGLDLLVHIECKTGNPRNITKDQIVEFKDRCKFVSADVNVFYVDYNGLDFDKDAVLKWFLEVFYEGASSTLHKITRKDAGFEIYKVDIAPIFIVDTNKNSKSVVENFREVFSVFFKMRYQDMLSSGLDPHYLKDSGYVIEDLK